MTYDKDDALKGGPGLDGYAFHADVYCSTCAEKIIDRLPMPVGGWEGKEFCDSEVLPQPIFFGESDTAEHCGECGEYLYGSEDEDGESSGE